MISKSISIDTGGRVANVLRNTFQYSSIDVHWILFGQHKGKIIHGNVECVLRRVIREQLRKYKEVASVSTLSVEEMGLR